MKEIASRLDLKDWENFSSQALKSFMIINLGNNNGIYISELIAALCHKSVVAHKSYNKTSSISETNRYKALDIVKSKSIVYYYISTNYMWIFYILLT